MKILSNLGNLGNLANIGAQRESPEMRMALDNIAQVDGEIQQKIFQLGQAGACQYAARDVLGGGRDAACAKKAGPDRRTEENDNDSGGGGCCSVTADFPDFQTGTRRGTGRLFIDRDMVQ